MYKQKKIILIYSSQTKNDQFFKGILEAAGYCVELTHDKKSFFELLNKIIPDMIIFHLEGAELEDFELLVSVKSTHEFRHMKIICINNGSSILKKQKIQKLNIHFLPFPTSQIEIIHKVSTLLKGTNLIGVHLEEKIHLCSQVFVDIYEISETHFRIRGPIKLVENSEIQCFSDFFTDMGLTHSHFDVVKSGKFKKEKLFESECVLMGVGSEVYRNIKKY